MQTGVESPSFLAARRVTLSVQSFQSEVADDAPADVAVERLVEREPDMFMDQMVREVPWIERLSSAFSRPSRVA